MLEFDPDDEDVIWARRVRGFCFVERRVHRAEKAKTLKVARQDVGMTQQDLAEYLGVSVRSIKSWESGKTVPNECYMDKITWIKIQAKRNPATCLELGWLPSRLKELRLTLWITQAELAKRLNVTRSTLARWESGEAVPTISAQLKIFNLFPDEE